MLDLPYTDSKKGLFELDITEIIKKKASQSLLENSKNLGLRLGKLKLIIPLPPLGLRSMLGSTNIKPVVLISLNLRLGKVEKNTKIIVFLVGFLVFGGVILLGFCLVNGLILTKYGKKSSLSSRVKPVCGLNLSVQEYKQYFPVFSKVIKSVCPVCLEFLDHKKSRMR